MKNPEARRRAADMAALRRQVKTLARELEPAELREELEQLKAKKKGAAKPSPEPSPAESSKPEATPGATAGATGEATPSATAPATRPGWPSDVEIAESYELAMGLVNVLSALCSGTVFEPRLSAEVATLVRGADGRIRTVKRNALEALASDTATVLAKYKTSVASTPEAQLMMTAAGIFAGPLVEKHVVPAIQKALANAQARRVAAAAPSTPLKAVAS